MLAALFKTLRTLSRPYFLKMLLMTPVVTAAAFGVLFAVVAYSLHATAFVSTGWLELVLDWTAGLGAGVLAWFLFPALLPLVAALFLETVAGTIERREYGLETPPSPAFWPEVAAGLKFAGLSLFLNLIALPLYMIPLLFPVIYYAINGYLLGREFFETVAGRREGRKAAAVIRRRHRTPVLLSGMIIALCATLPLAGLFAPFAGVAMMVHLHQAKKPGG